MEQIDKVELASTSHIVRNNNPERPLISINKVPLHQTIFTRYNTNQREVCRTARVLLEPII